MSSCPVAVVSEVVRAFFDSGVKGINLESTEIEGMGDTAFEIGKYTILGDGDQALGNGKYIVIWKKVGEEWKLHRDMINSSMPLPMEEDAEDDDDDDGEEEEDDDAAADDD